MIVPPVTSSLCFPVRAKAASVYSLLMDEPRLEAERKAAKANEGKYKGYAELVPPWYHDGLLAIR